MRSNSKVGKRVKAMKSCICIVGFEYARLRRGVKHMGWSADNMQFIETEKTRSINSMKAHASKVVHSVIGSQCSFCWVYCESCSSFELSGEIE